MDCFASQSVCGVCVTWFLFLCYLFLFRELRLNQRRFAQNTSSIHDRRLRVTRASRVRLPRSFYSVHRRRSYLIARAILYHRPIPTYGPACQSGHGGAIYYSVRRIPQSFVWISVSGSYTDSRGVSLIAIRERRFDFVASAIIIPLWYPALTHVPPRWTLKPVMRERSKENIPELPNPAGKKAPQLRGNRRRPTRSSSFVSAHDGNVSRVKY